ncbi:MAG TPA: BA14K family protein [Rhizobiaceae bacterium]|nr:BA14K family protein [Rhizobiaceae bacterium]
MHGLLRWMVSIAAIVSLNIAAVPNASALVVVPAPVKLESTAPQAIQAGHGGNRQIRRYGGGGRSYSGGSRGSRAYSSRQGGYRVKASGRRSGYNNVRRYSGRYDGRANRDYVRKVRRHDGRRYDGRHARNAYRHSDHRRHGKRYKNRHGNYRYYRDGWWYGWPWWLGVGVGVGIYLDAPVYRGDDRHVAWCLRRYRSYSPATNTWFGYDGRVHVCISPYSY